MQHRKIGVLYITYDGLCDPLGQAQVIPYVRELARQGIQIAVLSFEKKRPPSLINEIHDGLGRTNILWRPLRYHNKPRIVAAFYDAVSGVLNGFILARRYGLNVVHARGYVPSLMALWLKRIMGIRFIFDMRGFWPEEKVDAGLWSKESAVYKGVKRLESRLLDLADRIVVLTEKARLSLSARHRKSADIDVIPTCVDLKIFQPLKGNKKDFLRNRIVVLYSGSIGTFYGFQEVIRFFSILRRKEDNSFLLALVNNGQGIAEEILNSHDIGKDSYRIMTLSYPEVPGWLKEADVSLMFYHRDNSSAGCCPTKFSESLACGVPVIINRNIGDCDEIIRRERVGFVLDDFQDSSFGKTGEELLSAIKERENLRIRCRQAAESLFALETGVRRYSEIYKGLV